MRRLEGMSSAVSSTIVRFRFNDPINKSDCPCLSRRMQITSVVLMCRCAVAAHTHAMPPCLPRDPSLQRLFFCCFLCFLSSRRCHHVVRQRADAAPHSTWPMLSWTGGTDGRAGQLCFTLLCSAHASVRFPQPARNTHTHARARSRASRSLPRPLLSRTRAYARLSLLFPSLCLFAPPLYSLSQSGTRLNPLVSSLSLAREPKKLRLPSLSLQEKRNSLCPLPPIKPSNLTSYK